MSDQTVRRWIKAGKLAAYKPGKEYRVSEDDLEQFSRESQVPKVLAQPSQAEAEAARDQTPWELRQSVVKVARARIPWDQLQGVIKAAEGTCAYWEDRLEDDAGLSNDEVRSLASIGPTLALTLDGFTNAELRDLRYQYPDMDDVRPLSRLEPVRHRWVRFMIRVARLRLFEFPDDPEARQVFREFRQWTETLDKEHA